MLVLNKIRQKFQSEDRKRLLENFFSLSVLQGVNYILPLITLPYLVRVLGPEKFGLIAFAQAFIAYFIILTNYGFNLSATREISINRDKKEKVSEIFNSVMMVKFLLGVLSFFILALVLIFIPKFRNDWLVYIFTFGMVIGQILFPVWFFQGMERMKYITILNIVAKGIFTICIFIFIRKMTDYLYVPLINSIGFLVAGGVSLKIVSKDFGIKFMLPSFKAIKHQLKEGWYIFISTVAVSFYRTLPSTLIGVFYSYKSVGYYTVGEKIIRAIVNLLQPVTQTLFPYISKKIFSSRKEGIDFAFKVLKILSIFTLLVSSILFLFSHEIILFFAGDKFQRSIIVLKILAPLPFIVGIANIFGVQLMLNLGLKKKFSQILILGGILSIFLNIILIPLFEIKGASVAVIVSESLVMISMAKSVLSALKTTNKFLKDRI